MGSTNLERVEAFRIDRTYYLRHYFDESAYEALKPFYEPGAHRFAIPVRSFQGLATALRSRGYAIRIHHDIAPFVVVVRRYNAHPDVIFQTAVYEWQRDGHHLFVLNEAAAVDAAVEDGAVRLADAPVGLPPSCTVDRTASDSPSPQSSRPVGL